MKLIIDIPEDVFKRTVFYREFGDLNDYIATIKALEKAVPLSEELEKIKEEISKIDKIYYPDLSFNETGDCYIHRNSVADVIDKHIKENKQ